MNQDKATLGDYSYLLFAICVIIFALAALGA